MAFNFPNIANNNTNPYSTAINSVVTSATKLVGRVTQAFKSTTPALEYGNPGVPAVKEKVITQELEEVPELKKADIASKEVARFVLANPSPEAVKDCNKFYDKFGNTIDKYKIDEGDVNHILEAIPSARSSIGWKQNPDQSQRLTKQKQWIDDIKSNTHCFCDKDFATASADRESITTGAGYRAINASWVGRTTTPSPGLTKMLEEIDTNDYLVAAIGKEFPERSNEDMDNSSETRGVYFPQGIQDAIPGASGPQPGLIERAFTKKSYVSAKGIDNGIPMRAHVSGSMPLTLGVDEFIMNDGRKRGQADPEAIRLAGGVFTALYDIGDYHTVAESAAGVEHRIQELTGNRLTDKDRPMLNDVDPRNFLAMGIGMMNRVVDEKKLPEFNGKVQTLLESVEAAKQARQPKLQANKALDANDTRSSSY